MTPDFERELTIAGGFFNDLASKSDPKAFVYAFEGTAFPNVPLLQPRLGSVEEWRFVNNNNDEHPMHIHVNDFQVTHYVRSEHRSRDGSGTVVRRQRQRAGADLGGGRVRHPARHVVAAHEASTTSPGYS